MFTPVQIEILDMISHVKEQEDFVAIRNIIANYFADKAEKAIDRMWDEGEIDEHTLEVWKNEHMRTPYKS